MCLAMEAVPSILVDLIMSMTSSVKGVIGMSILEQGSSKQIYNLKTYKPSFNMLGKVLFILISNTEITEILCFLLKVGIF